MAPIAPGICLYTIRHAFQKDAVDALQLLAAVGYRSVELYGPCDACNPQQLRDALESSGLAPVAWHMRWEDLAREGAIPSLQDCGCQTVVVSTLFGDQRMPTRGQWLGKMEEINHRAVELAKEGLRLGCHTSALAFSTSEGASYYELMLNLLSPNVLIELDTGNCCQGGFDPAKAISMCCTHPLYLHLKPYSPEKRYNVVLGEEADVCDWKAILASGEGRVEQWLLEGSCNSLNEMHVACLSLEHFRRLMAP